MHSNQKLSGVLKGRTIASTQNQDGALLIGFDDGSQMKIKTAPSQSNSAQTGGTIEKVRQQDTALALDFENGATLEVQTAEASSCVMVRDKSNGLEYAD